MTWLLEVFVGSYTRRTNLENMSEGLPGDLLHKRCCINEPPAKWKQLYLKIDSVS